MRFETALYMVLGASAALLMLGAFLIYRGREDPPSLAVADELVADGEERRGTHKHFLRMLLGLDSLEHRYVKFTTRALTGFAIVGVTTVVGLGTSAYLLHRLSAVASQNRRGVINQCHDIEDLKAAIRGTLAKFGEAADPPFHAQHCPHIQKP